MKSNIKEIIDCIAFVLFFAFMVFGAPWIYYILTGNLMEF